MLAQPLGGGPRRGQQLFQLTFGRAPPPRLAEQDEKERGGVDAAVVVAVSTGGALAEPGPVGEAHLVQDLAGLLLVARVVDAALSRGQGLQGVEHKAGVKGPGLVARDQGVPAEQRDEPRDARGQEASRMIERVGHAEPPKVGQRASTAGGQEHGIGGHVHGGAARGTRAGHRAGDGSGGRGGRVNRQC